jgi:hypothetical protein
LTEEPNSYPLLIELVKRSWLPWHWVLVIVAIVLLLLLVLVPFLDNNSIDLTKLNFWRDYLDGPVLVIYILAVYPILWRRWWRSVQSLQSLLLPDDESTDPAVTGVLLPNRRLEWVTIFIGAVIWPLLWQPWEWNWIRGELWVNTYDVGTQVILFGILGWLVYTVSASSRYVSRLSRLRLNVDVFDTESLMPIARSNLGFSLAFIGGISLSLIFQTPEDLISWKNIIVWAAIICFSVLLFFLSTWSTHTAMIRLKKSEMQIVQQNLKAFSRKLNQPISDDQLNRMGEFSSTITAWLTYERRIKEAPEWPFNAGIVRKLVVSALAPVAVFLIKVISGLGISI